MPAEFALDPLERKAGDHGPAAAVYARLLDDDGQPVTTGTVTLRIGTFLSGPYTAAGTHLLDAVMAHTADGVWRWEPADDDLQVGRWRMSLHTTAVDGVTVPAGGYGTLLVLPRLAEATP